MGKMGLALLAKMLPMILGRMTPILREELEKLMRSLYVKALQTENPWDDMALEFIGSVLGVSLEDSA